MFSRTVKLKSVAAGHWVVREEEKRFLYLFFFLGGSIFFWMINCNLSALRYNCFVGVSFPMIDWRMTSKTREGENPFTFFVN